VTAQRRPLLRFALWVMALLPTCFVAWWFLGTWITAPAYLLADLLLSLWLPGAVSGSSLDGTTMTVLSRFGEMNGSIFSTAAIGNQLGFRIDTRVLSYSLPFYAALHFATPVPASWERFARALLALWLLMALGIVATALKDLMVTIGDPFLALPWAPAPVAIALGYQLSSLIVPPLAPVLLWAYGARDVPAFRALLPPALRGGITSDA
jgi:hypothetical protein